MYMVKIGPGGHVTMLTSITDGVLRSELICHSQVRNNTSWQPPAGSAGDICEREAGRATWSNEIKGELAEPEQDRFGPTFDS